ncbi:hypothetical protein CXU17_11200 [Akkermansia muciniphila]|nr:hypothetical protein CXU17_11200 [Akkermansia muciniphila]
MPPPGRIPERASRETQKKIQSGVPENLPGTKPPRKKIYYPRFKNQQSIPCDSATAKPDAQKPAGNRADRK